MDGPAVIKPRTLVKAAVHAVAARGGAARLARYAHSRRAVVLAYHNIVPDGAPVGGDRSLHLPRAAFVAQLEALAQTHDIVPLGSLLAERSDVGRRRPRAAITFDDAYAGATELGVAELARLRLPATIFVTPGALGGRLFWWDRIATPEARGVPLERRDHALYDLAGEHERVIEWAHAEGLLRPLSGELRDALRSATEAELCTCKRYSGVTLASHTWSHPNLARVAPDALTSELERSLAWLRAHFPDAEPWLSYPYGSLSLAVKRKAEDTGYATGFEMWGGYMRADQAGDRYALPRVNVPAGASLDRFVTLVAGLY